jgi:hypothetical protein
MKLDILSGREVGTWELNLRDKERFRELARKSYCEEKLKPPLDELCRIL